MSDSLGVQELSEKSAGIVTWVLSVRKPRLIEYKYAWQNQPRTGQTVECRLVAVDGVVCHCVFKALSRSGSRGGGADPDVELKGLQNRFKDGALWRTAKVVLANGKSECISSPLKACIDLHEHKMCHFAAEFCGDGGRASPWR